MDGRRFHVDPQRHDLRNSLHRTGAYSRRDDCKTAVVAVVVARALRRSPPSAQHRSRRPVALGGRFHNDIAALGLVNSLLVFLFAHQLGYFYRDGSLARVGRRGQVAMLVGALTLLAILTSAAGYPRSMVAVSGGTISNMFP